ncbi:helix-turn-helix domain-containing protein [Sphaerimonospora thailandensis]|uniref:Helix-turn-helix domain-containing protein n=1 Tax=Sphaerimonospora thailandensis TaxID=795644 RepID=A0A8J3R6S6_9ACTN|nr:helix-turn-helix domain-containing protein [Sphaerimonospora thailandensis]GIH69488.1 hypothetical protein Mth01_17410 [Sphaerimonospora thailandensis]
MTKPENETALLTIPEAAKELRCSYNTVARLIARGALPSTDIAPPGSKRSRTRVPRDGLHAYIAARTTPAKPARRRTT